MQKSSICFFIHYHLERFCTQSFNMTFEHSLNDEYIYSYWDNITNSNPWYSVDLFKRLIPKEFI